MRKSVAKTIYLLPMLVLAVASGCNRHSETNKSSASTPQPAAPPPGITVPDNGAAADSLNGEVDPTLTKLLRGFIRQKGHLPQDFNELAQARPGQIPEPPSGKKWAINFQTTEVKTVNGP